MSTLPENMINYTVWEDADRKMGTANIDLPSLDALAEKVKGAAIAGEIDAPVLGHYAAMSLGVSWRTITKDAATLAKPVAHNLTFRGSQQVYDSAAGTFSTVSVKIVVKAIPKKTSLGKLVVAGNTDTKNEFEIPYIKVFVGGEEKFELDKYNFICKIDGEDVLAQVRQDLGLE